MNIWKENIKALFLSFDIFFFPFFLVWLVDKPHPVPIPVSCIYSVMKSEQWRGGGGGGGRSQWSLKSESAFVCLYCHNLCQPVLYLPTTVPTCHKLGLSETFVCIVCETWNKIETRDSVRVYALRTPLSHQLKINSFPPELETFSVPFILVNADFFA